MGPPLGLVAASVISAHATLDESSMLQMPIGNQHLAADEDECRCPGYYQEQCEAEAAQGCVWTDAGESNEPWCQCSQPIIDPVPQPPVIEPVTRPPPPPVTLPPPVEPDPVYDCEICRQLAEDKGLEIGGVGWSFEGQAGYAPGCYTYTSGQYACHAYCGTGATHAQIAEPLARSDRARIDADYTALEQCASPVPATCPGDWVQVGEIGADIGGCGLQSCDQRYDPESEAECAASCDANQDCVAFSYAGMNGDRNHEGRRVCTLYNSDVPTGTWTSTSGTAVQVLCKRPLRHYLMVDGCLNQNTEVDSAVVRSDSGATASVRCCSLTSPATCDTDHLDGGCQSDKTYDEATAICAANGERLCTEAEIQDRLCCGTGCNFDGHQVWVLHEATTPEFPATISYLVVAGGGGGASGGGGAGGVKQGTMDSPLTSLTIEVGYGGISGNGGYAQGTVQATSGGNSAFDDIVAHGGGFGSQGGRRGLPAAGEGGSGGGGGFDRPNDERTTGMSGEGYGGGRSDRNSYGAGAGGGGAGGPGQDAPSIHLGGAGGIGVQSDVGCEAGQWYGGGGGGGVNHNDNNGGDRGGWGNGGENAGGGGGHGSGYGGGHDDRNVFTGTSGTANTGGGGGGTDPEAKHAGDGASGVVKIKYEGPQVYAGGDVESCNGFTVHTFSTVGTHQLQLL